jgi:Xaa-Pro aminopeptidase
MHGTSHFLGMDVHDVGNMHQPLQAGVVMTVEPGIYIAPGSDCDPKWWGIGVRIEDDIHVTENGPINMSAKLERTAEEIEGLMKAGL